MRGLAAAAVLVMAACAGQDADDTAAGDAAVDSTPAVVERAGTTGAAGDTIAVDFIDREGANAGGARLVRVDGGIEIAVRVTGLTLGEHGFHVHQVGECAAPGFESAGAHFSPEPKQHGLQNPQGPHAGDLPNLRADAGGVADTIFTVDRMAFGGASSLTQPNGLALVVHADADDYRTDPSGNAGDRVACGVIPR